MAAILHALAASIMLVHASLRPVLVCVTLLSLVASCTTPDVAPAADVAAPVVTQPEVVIEEVARTKPAPTQPPPTQPAPTQPSTAEPSPIEPRPGEPPPAEPIPWGSPLQTTGKSHGLRFTTTTQVERTAAGLQLAIDVELHNSTRAPMKVSLHPPLVSISAAPAPGSTGEGMGLGLRGEGFGSDVCSPGHGGPTTLPPGGRASVKRTVELDPLPWPPNQAYRITATSRDCRPSRLMLEVLDVIVVQPASPDGVPSLLAAPSDVARK